MYAPTQHLSSVVPLDGAHVMCEQRKLLSFCSEDYLGLSRHHDVKKNAIKAVLEYGVGTSDMGGAPVGLQEEIEKKCALYLGTESALLVPSYFQAAYALFFSLLPPLSLVLIDASMDQELIKLAEKSGKMLQTYTTIQQLEQLITEGKKNLPSHIPSQIAIVTASIFHREGNRCELETITSIAHMHKALLFVDDSYSFGVFGNQGMGLSVEQPHIDIILGSFSKGGGASNAYIGCTSHVRDSLVHLCPAVKGRFLPPATLGAIEASLDIIPRMEGERKQLMQRAHWLRQQLLSLNLSTGKSSTHIVPLFFESKEEKEYLQQALNEANILAVSNDKALYFYLTIHHSTEHLSRLFDALRGYF